MGADALCRRLAGALAAAAIAVGCGSDEPRVRIGVIVDCEGINRSFRDAQLAAARLPLLERGAEPAGTDAGPAPETLRLAGRRVELVPGCTEVHEFVTLTVEVRRLVENAGVDAVVAGSGGADQTVLRDLARRYPEVVFVPVVHGPREVTLRRPATNLFRFAGDHAQGAAGLADHAYRELGWRRAAVVAANWDAGWGAREAFSAEFCALGGEVAGHVTVDLFDPRGRDVADLPRGVDGVAVFTSGFFGPGAFLRRLARRVGDPARHVVVGAGIVDDPTLLRSTARALAGATGSSYVREPELRAYEAAFRRNFPGTPAAVARNELVTGYRDAVEALVRAVEAGGAPRALAAQLTRVRPDLLGGAVGLDGNRQAIVDTTLVRIDRPTAGDGARPLTPLRVIPEVDQSVGGLLDPALRPGDRPPACRRGRRPPRWST